MATAAYPSDLANRGVDAGGFTGLLRTLPLIITMGYLGLIFLIFLVWPINWSIYYASEWARLIAYVLLCYTVIAGCYLFGTRRLGRISRPLTSVPLIIVAGAIATVVLLFPLSYIYTGRWPWQILEVIAQQGEAYRSLQEQLEETAGQRGPIVILRALMSPLTYAVIPLGVIQWHRLGWFHRGCVVAALVATLTLSLMRGTDREFADLFIIAGSALLVALARFTRDRAEFSDIVRRYWLPALLAVVFLWFASSLFTERKSERLGGYENRTVVCANQSRICADLEAPLIRWLPLEQRFGASFFILSSASGYYGLALAMEKDFKPTYGLGHSPATLVVYELITGDDSLYQRSFTYRNSFDGWSDLNYWSTLITWIANDVGFVGAVLVLGLIGFIWGKMWMEATANESDSAAVLFTICMVMLFYLPANNQFFGVYDGYFIAGAWFLVWLREKYAARVTSLA